VNTYRVNITAEAERAQFQATVANGAKIGAGAVVQWTVTVTAVAVG
jgi:serine acetyltransferase